MLKRTILNAGERVSATSIATSIAKTKAVVKGWKNAPETPWIKKTGSSTNSKIKMAKTKKKAGISKKWSMGTQSVHSGEERVKYADALTVPRTVPT